MLSASHTHLATIGPERQPNDRRKDLHSLELVRQALGEEEFQAAREDGQRMTIQKAVRYALSEDETVEEPRVG